MHLGWLLFKVGSGGGRRPSLTAAAAAVFHTAGDLVPRPPRGPRLNLLRYSINRPHLDNPRIKEGNSQCLNPIWAKKELEEGAPALRAVPRTMG